MINITTAARGISKTLKNYVLTALYRVDQTNDPQLIQGNIDSTGYITGKKCGVFSYLVEPQATIIDTPDTWVHIKGDFDNDPIYDFLTTETGTGLKAIMYIGDQPMYFLVDWHGSLHATIDDVNVSIGVCVNGHIQLHSVMASYSKYQNLTNVMSGTDVVLLSPGDYVQLYITADKQTEIHVINFTTTIGLFYD